MILQEVLKQCHGVVGLDLSLRSTGISIWREGDEHWTTETIKTDVRDGGLLLRQYEILDVLEFNVLHPSRMVIIEDYAYAGHQTITLAEIGGAVKMALYRMYKRNGLSEFPPIFTVAPSTLKKWALGDSKKKSREKADMKLALYKKHEKELETDDEVDAYFLADIGRAILLERKDLSKHEEEVIRVVCKRWEGDYGNLLPKNRKKKETLANHVRPDVESR